MVNELVIVKAVNVKVGAVAVNEAIEPSKAVAALIVTDGPEEVNAAVDDMAIVVKVKVLAAVPVVTATVPVDHISFGTVSPALIAKVVVVVPNCGPLITVLAPAARRVAPLLTVQPSSVTTPVPAAPALIVEPVKTVIPALNNNVNPDADTIPPLLNVNCMFDPTPDGVNDNDPVSVYVFVKVKVGFVLTVDTIVPVKVVAVVTVIPGPAVFN